VFWFDAYQDKVYLQLTFPVQMIDWIQQVCTNTWARRRYVHTLHHSFAKHFFRGGLHWSGFGFDQLRLIQQQIQGMESAIDRQVWFTEKLDRLLQIPVIFTCGCASVPKRISRIILRSRKWSGIIATVL